MVSRLHALADLSASTRWIQGWVSRRAGVDPVVKKKIAQCWQFTYVRLAPDPSLLPVTELPQFPITNTVHHLSLDWPS